MEVLLPKTVKFNYQTKSEGNQQQRKTPGTIERQQIAITQGDY
jgi:hypothetical protein